MSQRKSSTKTRGAGSLKQLGYATSKFRTLHSAWTPMVNRASNEQIFTERTELICHWFDLWTDVQRKRFMTRILGKCSGMKILFNVKLAKEKVLIEHLDFTTVLPRFISLYIMSFLDPKTLSRAAQVSWYWKSLSEQDCLWMPKCMGQGWYLPYMPTDLEQGAWKRHYVHCALSLDIGAIGDIPSPARPELADEILPAADDKPPVSPRRSRTLSLESSRRMMSLRPPWMATSKKPNDIGAAARALLQNTNPNEPTVSRSAITFHDRFGTVRTRPIFNELQEPRSALVRQSLETRKQSDPATDGAATSKKLLSECSLQHDYSLKDRMASLKTQHWLFSGDNHRPLEKTEGMTNITGSMDHAVTSRVSSKYGGDARYSPHSTPRVLLISSKVPAYELLVDAAVFGVIPLVYDFDGSTVSSILNQLTGALQGRVAECIGLFTEYIEPGEILLCRGITINWATAMMSDVQQFFETLSLHTLPAIQQGHIDIFVPLPSTDEGLHIISKLERLTNGDTRFLSPLGLTANLKNQVSPEWCGLSLQVEPISPSKLYFHEYKLDIWSHAAHYVREAAAATKTALAGYFGEQQNALLGKVTGQLMFDAVGLLKIRGVQEVVKVVSQACISLANENNISPVEHVANYLMQAVETEKQKSFDHQAESTWQPETLQAIHQHYARFTFASPEESHVGNAQHDNNSLDDDGPHEELATIAAEDSGTEEEATHDESGRQDQTDAAANATAKDPNANAVEAVFSGKTSSQSSGPRDGSTALVTRHVNESPQNPLQSPPPSPVGSLGLRPSRDIGHSHVRSQGPSIDLSENAFSAEHMDLHKATAHTILHSELIYHANLGMIKDNFVLPLKRSIQSNRAIIGTGNLHTMFADVMVLYEVSSELTRELSNRMKEWSSSRFLGDIFEKFCGRLGAYVNYIHNYPTILQIIKKNIESYPQFRAFVARHEKTYTTKMLGLHELLLIPFERVQEYVTLLHVFKSHTARDHADRSLITNAIASIKEVHRIIKETHRGLQLAKRLDELQKKILHCPQLSEPGRHFITHQDFSVLKPVNNDDVKVADKYIIYSHEEDVGLFLFNDALLIAARFQHFVPFQRAPAFEYKFLRSLGLRTLVVEDILDSKFVKNAFKIRSSRYEWILTSGTYEIKFDFLTALESCITADVPRM